MRTKNKRHLLSDKFANSMLNNYQLNKIRGGEVEVPPVVIYPAPVPPRK